MTEIATRFKLPKRYGTPGPNVWLEMIEYAKKYNSIDLSVGFADFAPPKHVTEALVEVARSENLLLHQYTKGFGHPRLVNIIAKLYSKLINRDINPNTEIIISEGAQQSLYNIFNGILDEGDEVIVIEPFFEPYDPMIRESGAIPKYIPLRRKPTKDSTLSTNDYYLDKIELESMFNAKTKAILVNTPNNPLGKVFNMEEMRMIADLCKKWNALCIADEVYEWLVYKPNVHIRMATLPNMWERTITVGSAGKTLNITGWRTGWCYGPANLMKNLQVVHQNCIYTHLTPIQEAIAIAFEKEFDLLVKNKTRDCFLFTLNEELRVKRDFLVNSLRDVGIKPIEPQGGYLLLADVESFESKADLSKETDKYKDFRLTKWLAKNGLMGFPASPFYSETNKSLAENCIRFCFIKEDKKLQEANGVLQGLTK